MASAERFEELEVWQRARELTNDDDFVSESTPPVSVPSSIFPGDASYPHSGFFRPLTFDLRPATFDL